MFYRYDILLFLPRLGKPEALTAAAIVTKEHWNAFIPFDKTTHVPEGTPCRKEALLLFRLAFNASGFRRSGRLPAGLCIHRLGI